MSKGIKNLDFNPVEFDGFRKQAGIDYYFNSPEFEGIKN